MGRISMLSQKLRNAIFQFRGWERRRKICNVMLVDIALKFRKPFRWHRCKPRTHVNIGYKFAAQLGRAVGPRKRTKGETLFGSGWDALTYPSARARNLSWIT
jgi:hypothetical protein